MRSASVLDIGCLLAFLALNYIERNLFPFFQGLEAVHVNVGKVREQIFAAIVGCNETKAFGVIEPLDRTSCHIYCFLQKTKKRETRISPTRFESRYRPHGVAIHLESKLRTVYAPLFSRQALFSTLRQENGESGIFIPVLLFLARAFQPLNIRQPEIMVEMMEC
jgi:hypothetical protein